MNNDKLRPLTTGLIAQMFDEDEGILAKFTEVSEDTVEQWLWDRDIEAPPRDEKYN